MIPISSFVRKIGDYQRPYLTAFKILRSPFSVGSPKSLSSETRTDLQDRCVGLQDQLKGQRDTLSNLLDANKTAGSLGLFNMPVLEQQARIMSTSLQITDIERRLSLDDEHLSKHYPFFDAVMEDIDFYSLKTVFPERKSVKQEFWWEGERFYYPGRDDSPKSGDFTFILDQNMLLLPFLYAMKDLTGTSSGHYKARRGYPIGGVTAERALDYLYTQEFELGVFQIATDRHFITNAVRLVGTRVYGVGDVKTDKTDEGTQVSVVTCDMAWDYMHWDDSFIGLPFRRD